MNSEQLRKFRGDHFKINGIALKHHPTLFEVYGRVAPFEIYEIVDMVLEFMHEELTKDEHPIP